MFTSMFVLGFVLIFGLLLLPWLILKLIGGLFHVVFSLIGGLFSLIFGLVTGLFALFAGMFAAVGAALVLVVALPLLLGIGALLALAPVLLPVAAVAALLWLIVVVARRSSAAPAPLSLPSAQTGLTPSNG